MNRNGLILSHETWTGKACPICASELFESDHYIICSSHRCSYGGLKEEFKEKTKIQDDWSRRPV